MKKSVILLASLALAGISLLASCSSGKSAEAAEAAEAQDAAPALTVDQVLSGPDALVGDTITIEGVCSHLCRHGGRKAFVAGTADSLMLRCEAYPLMGEPFPKSTVHHPIRVRGILREQRIDEAAVKEMERQNDERIAGIASEQGEQYAELAERAESGCDTERAAQGQKDLTTFRERMADYRKRIAERQAREGKPYLSFYYLDAISYTTLEE
ncbi:MAG: hypothetical protein NC193_10110 [bacterium]|nr:hypothetical protein [bacterium]